jgi:hypothetical protein
MSQPSRIYFDQFDVDERISELGLKREIFETAAKENYAAFASCTPNHPPTFPGLSAWAEMNRSIADSLIIARWGAKQSERNLPLVVNNSQTMAITASSGDEYTGRKEDFPGTSSAKGPCSADFVRANKRQQKFAFMEDPTEIRAAMKIPGRSTWIYLVYRDLTHNELRHELSRPISMSEDGHVNDWAERIIFSSIPLDPEIRLVGNDTGTDGQSGEITVEIKKLG